MCLLKPAPQDLRAIYELPHLAVLGKCLCEFSQAGFSDFAGFVEGFVGDVFPLLDGVQDGVDFSGGFGFADLVNSTHGVCVCLCGCSISSGLGEQVQPTAQGRFDLVFCKEAG